MSASGFQLNNSRCNKDPADKYCPRKLIGRIKPAGCMRHVLAYNVPWSSTPPMPTVEAVRQRGRTKYHKKLAPLVFARMTKLQHAVQSLPRRAWTERLRVGGSFYSRTFGIGGVGVPLCWA